jgi:hypothetical protein
MTFRARPVVREAAALVSGGNGGAPRSCRLSAEVLVEDETIDVLDRFALLYRLPNGKTVPDQFLASWPFGHAEPHGVYADDQEPSSAGVASLTGKVTGALMTRIAADVRRYRTVPPAIANTDDDPMCLISATIAVEEGTVGKLAARPDFGRDSDDPDQLTWWGALIPDGQREAMMAEAMAQLRAQGHQDAGAHEGSQRWIRGVLRVRGREISVEVNSQQRLTRLLGILRKADGKPVVTSEKRIDPAQDFAWRPGSALPRAALRLRPKAGRSPGSMSRFPHCSAGHLGRPHEAESGRTWRRCCGSSSTRPASWPSARPVSIRPGCASNPTCRIIVSAKRLDGATAHPGRKVQPDANRSLWRELRPRGRDRGVGPADERQAHRPGDRGRRRFSSAIMPPWCRETPKKAAA